MLLSEQDGKVQIGYQQAPWPKDQARVFEKAKTAVRGSACFSTMLAKFRGANWRQSDRVGASHTCPEAESLSTADG